MAFGWLFRRSALAEDIAVLLIRFASGTLLAMHGLAKIRAGTEGFAQGLAGKGFPAPGALAYAATLSELVGGALVAVGLLTRPASAASTVTMCVAWISSHLHQAGLVGTGQGVPFEYPFLLSIIFAAFTIAGGGRFSLDARRGV